MLKMKKQIINQVLAIKEVKELRKYLQNAIELEHATIPVYLTGLFSIKPGTNKEVSNIIRSVVVEEMLHMSIACNVLNAIGGHPEINKPDFVPTFPGPLPMGVGEDRGLIATLAPLSKQQIFDVYMAIEEPEEKLHGQPDAQNTDEDDDYSTIGEFYDAIISKITDLGEDIFTGKPGLQMVANKWFSEDELWAIKDVDTATRGLNLIIEQGEGSHCSPLDPEKQMAHYYRFAEIYYGNKLVKDTSAASGWSFSGDPVPFDEGVVFDLISDPKATRYPEGTAARRYADQTNYTYSSLLNNLHQTFNGHPGKIDEAMGLMYELRLSVQKMVTIPLEGGYCAAPCFEYVKVNA